MNIRETVKLRKEKCQKNGGIEFDTCIVSTKELDELLNLIDKQNKGLNKLKSKNKELLRKLRNRVKENNKLIKYSNYKKEFSTLNKQIDKQNKVIDELIQELTDDEFDNPCTECCKECEKDNDTLFNCIKQYFIRKVEKDEQS